MLVMVTLRCCLISLSALYLIGEVYAIKGSIKSTKGQFPFQADLIINMKSTTLYRTGSLISRNYILTTASNVKESKKITVVLGAYNVEDKQEQSRRTYDGVLFKTHEKYTSETDPNNIALVKLNQPAEISKFVKIIPIGRCTIACLPLIGKSLRVSGWGDVTEQTPPEYQVLRYADVEIKLFLACRDSFPLVSYKQLCTTDTTKHFEESDIGAPLVLETTQVGIASATSYVNGVATGPQLYTKIDAHMEWIEANSDAFITSN